jgi:hypothetical protein
VICPHGHDEGMVERVATPEEVDAGCELGVASDPCPGCVDDVESRVDAAVDDRMDALLGIPDFDEFDDQAETGQGPPA